MTSADQLRLASEFDSATKDRWRAMVDKVLRRSGVDVDGHDGPVEDLLASPTYDGFALQPLYTADDTAPAAGFPGLPPFTRGSRPDGAVATGWDVRQRHAHPDVGTTRRAVLADLENGVTSLWLVVGPAGVPAEALPDVLADVYVDLAPVTLDAGADFAAAADALLAIHDDKGVQASGVRGNLGADPLGHRARVGPPAAPSRSAGVPVRARWPSGTRTCGQWSSTPCRTTRRARPTGRNWAARSRPPWPTCVR
jgi:methylmalonyl-CoA mutase